MYHPNKNVRCPWRFWLFEGHIRNILFLAAIAVLFQVLTLTTGCTQLGYLLEDPNRNDKMRYSMAHIHADRVLREAGSNLSSYRPDYNTIVFIRRPCGKSTGVRHKYELWEFLKTSSQPGPSRFVIAYDNVTRKTYLRANLHSDENLERLPPTTQPVD